MNSPLLLLHGALGSKEQLTKLKNSLSNQFNTYYFDFEGHGSNMSSNDFTIESLTKNVVAFLKANQLEKVNVFGYSMGGYVGLNLARKNPELVDKLMTLGTKFDWTKAAAEREIKMLNPQKIEEKVPSFANALARIHSSNNWKDVVNRTAKMMYNLSTGAMFKNEDLEKITHEVLIGIGSIDKMVSTEESTKSAEILPNGKLIIIEGFEHSIDKIDQLKLVEIIENFLVTRNLRAS